MGPVDDGIWCPRRRHGVVLRRDTVRDVMLVLQPERLARLNATAAAILRLCDGTRTVSAIEESLSSEYPDEPPPRISAAVGRFVDAAVRERWIE
jgi:pyrroloquinoline quinone biosynthesis protein D